METNRCPACGAVIDSKIKGSVICSYCGTKLYVDNTGKASLTLDEISKTKETKNNSKTPIIIFSILFIVVMVTALLIYNFSKKEPDSSKTNPLPVSTTSTTSHTINDVKNLKIGDSFLFGEYEQDNNKTNGKEKIEWIVLERQEKKSLVIAKYGLDHIKYNDKFEFTTWEKSSIRKWLNESFINSVFNNIEKNYIVETSNSTEYACNKNTNDKVFLLSVTEAESLFNGDEDRTTTATAYAIANGVKAYEDSSCWWWLRSVCEDNEYAMNVRSKGNVRYSPEIAVNEEGYAVRPAMWVNYDGVYKETKQQETKPITITTGKLEILDEKMGVYSSPYADRTWIKSVYQGNTLDYYETYADGTYTWYRIGKNEWVRDSNGSRVKVKQSISNSTNSSSSFNIEILDEKMGVYDSYKIDRGWVKSVYQGETYKCLGTYNDGVYYWYKIGNNEWIKDDDGTRVKTHK